MTYSISLRRKVISYVEKGGGKREASRLFQISPDTLYRWLNSEDLAPKKHGSRNRKIDKEKLRREVDNNPDALLRERAVIFNVSPSAISQALKKMKIVKKRA
ncbi:MAG: helix-turn-helix domain-containing protein [Alphaproteobacteria bacterium]|nr:helix-turn-helix domain-containing protein [Alphaproteobacteria bacterium]